MRFTLTLDQQYIADILEVTSFLRMDQVHRLLKKIEAGKDRSYAKRLLGQLCYVNRAFPKAEDTITLPHFRQREIDFEMLAAVDIMLDLLESPPPALSAKKPPFKLSFLVERGEDILPFGVISVEPGREREICFKLDDSYDITVVFLLSDMRQSELIRTQLKHYFAVYDDKKLRYFKGNSA